MDINLYVLVYSTSLVRFEEVVYPSAYFNRKKRELINLITRLSQTGIIIFKNKCSDAMISESF